MRLAALVILCILVIAVSSLRFEPMKPDARLPTFTEMNDPSRAHPAVSVPKSADRKQIQQAVLNAASRLQNSPCDKSLRQALRTAIAAYIKARREDDPRAPDEDQQIVREASAAGILPPEDMPTSFDSAALPVLRATGMTNSPARQADHSNYRGRFACSNG